jgi:flagellar operon protein
MSQIDKINTTKPITSSEVPLRSQQAANGQNFADALAQAQGVKFSNHAQKRLQSRSIALTDDGLSRLATAIDKADKRGGKESRVLLDEMAFIVNVKERLIVTAMDAHSRGEGVFTQIDSVVLADSTKDEKNVS